MKKLFDFVKVIVFFFWNRQVRDSSGKIIPDFRRRFKSWQINRGIAKGTIKTAARKGNQPRRHKVMVEKSHNEMMKGNINE